MSKPTRNTKKSRFVAELSEAIANLVNCGNTAPSKDVIVNSIVSNSLGEGASTIIRTTLEDEIANELERYFHDAVLAAAAELGMENQWHLVTSKYYTKKHANPTRDMLRQHVCTFGNGRTGKAAGVRFVRGEGDDILFAIVTDKLIDNTQKANAAAIHKVSGAIDSGALPKPSEDSARQLLGQPAIEKK